MSFFAPVAGSRVKATPPVPERSPELPNAICWTLTAVPPLIGDLVHLAVDVCARVIPAAEHGLNRLDELLVRVLRKGLCSLSLIDLLEDDDKLLEIVRASRSTSFATPLATFFCPIFLLISSSNRLLDTPLTTSANICEAAVAVVGKAKGLPMASWPGPRPGRVVQCRLRISPSYRAWDRRRTGAHGHEQGIFDVAELRRSVSSRPLARVRENVRPGSPRDRVVLRAGLGRDGEAPAAPACRRGHLPLPEPLPPSVLRIAVFVTAERLTALAEIIRDTLLIPFTSNCSIFRWDKFPFYFVYIHAVKIHRHASQNDNDTKKLSPKHLNNIRKEAWFFMHVARVNTYIRRVF